MSALNPALLGLTLEQPTNFYGVFSGEINQFSAQKFFDNFAIISQQPVLEKHLHLLIQSGGGAIAEGIAMYNLIHSAPFDVSLYNSGTLQSMATIVFMAAKRRVVNENATFMLHRATCAPQPMTTDRMKDVLGSLKLDDDRINEILKRHLNLSKDQWSNLRDHEFWLTAKDALASGLATEIGDFAPPRGSAIRGFNM